MAKSRKFTISRSERFLGSYGFAGNHPTKDDGVELREDDVWSMVDEIVNDGDHCSINSDWNPRAAVDDHRSVKGRRGSLLPAPGSAGGLSVAFDDHQPGKMVATPRIIHQFRTGGGDGLASPRGRHVATSAPVNVPDWSKIYRVNSVESMHDSDDGTDDQDSDMVPPHEYLARSHRSAAKSVFEGVGRTLKGRDMSRVRDAVWSQTGFDG
ncbi:uncharacterized protein LOC112527020 [Cynara cardunculus var. scolymus]|uniref:Senescence regulator n=1 Tax=Cynara cardunculus var. scolymus TaxID=59895 RepID=A0A103XFA1_CYNCS|nr:uncharacterized protein LOC112527020 [Cynara cardunculus var. scolymus]KVH89618.1 Senescence regulator [Cynara cardunculus var. scolymus]